MQDLETRPSAPRDGFARGAGAHAWHALRCSCGAAGFRLTGWPRVTTGRGGLFWRSVARIFREARQPMDQGELRESPFWLPIRARCTVCDLEAVLLDASVVGERLPETRRGEPLESVRCRVCRRGRMEVLIGEEVDAAAPDRADHVVVARCLSCARESRIAWSRGRPSEQEVTLDLLYGRR